MIEIRLHGRGGQGAVLASHMLARALFKEGYQVQSFPFFGFERRGAPVVAYVRADDRPIRLRCGIYRPDHVILFDAALAQVVDITAGLKPGGWIVVNSAKEVDFPPQFHLAIIDANEIAAKFNLGPATLRAVNTAMLGAFAAASGLVRLESLLESLREEAGLDPERNSAAMKEAFETVRIRRKE